MTRILLVEDNELEADTIRLFLRERPDWEVTRVASVREAMRKVRETEFDAAVLDYNLPDGTGLELLDSLRAERPNLRIMLLTGAGSESIAFNALSHGASDYLVKDFHMRDELPRRLEDLLGDGSPERAVSLVGESDAEAPPLASPPANPALAKVVGDVLGGPTLAAAVFDKRGKPLASKLLAGLDPEAAGFALASIQTQIGSLWTTANLKPTSYLLIVEVEGGMLAVTAVPGPYVVMLLFETSVGKSDALDRIRDAAHRVSAALHP